MNQVQPSALESVVDRPATEPEAGELDAGDNTVLEFRELGDRGV